MLSPVASAMGIDCHNVRQIIHLGAPCDIESYIQETGRAGRDGLPSIALLLSTRSSNRFIESDMRCYVLNTDLCCRTPFLKPLIVTPKLQWEHACVVTLSMLVL